MTPLTDELVAPPGVSCPQCATRLPSHDPAASRFFCCPTCRTFFEATPGAPGRDAKRLDQFKKAVATGPMLPLGATGELGGHRCRITGYQVRSEKNDKSAEWREYQLRPLSSTGAPDPADFPLQLAEYQGHWLLVRRALQKVISTNNGWEEADGRDYRLWHKYQPVVRDAQGEFDWNVLDDEHLHIEEFISPPYQLVREQATRQKPAWYRAEYLEPTQVAAAFGLRPERLPERQGIGAAQPGRVPDWPQLRQLSILAGGLLLAGQALLLVLAPPGTILDQQFQPYAATATGSSQMLASRPFELPRTATLQVQLTTPYLDNHWLEVTASLVNEKTGQGFEFTRSIEYYHGVEGGESWSEGGTSTTAVLSRVPAGRYHVNLYPSFDPAQTDSTSLGLQVEQDTPLWSNFWLALATLAALPLGVGWWRRRFEVARWQNSNFSPYPSSDSDD